MFANMKFEINFMKLRDLKDLSGTLLPDSFLLLTHGAKTKKSVDGCRGES